MTDKQNTAEHTPGPWEIVDYRNQYKYGGDFPYRIQGADHFSPCMIYADGTENRGTSEANAALIAAAPDLLEALERTLNDYEYDLTHRRRKTLTDHEAETLATARAAISLGKLNG